MPYRVWIHFQEIEKLRVAAGRKQGAQAIRCSFEGPAQARIRTPSHFAGIDEPVRPAGGDFPGGTQFSQVVSQAFDIPLSTAALC